MTRTPVAGSPDLPLFSDLHMHERSLAVTIRVMAGMREEAVQNGWREVGFTGDWFHLRDLMPLQVYSAYVDELDRYNAAGIRIIQIPGNHDIYNVQSRHGLEALRTHPALRLYERPTVDRWGYWVPYMAELDDVRRALDLHRGRGLAVFWHGPMLGAHMNDHCVADRGLAVADFEGYAVAVLGHFHGRQAFGHVAYVGSPWETRADEAGQPKGYAVLRGGSRLEYHDRVWGPRHHRAEGDADDVIAQLLAARAEDRVRAVVPEADVARVSRALAGRFEDYSVVPSKVEAGAARPLPAGGFTLRDHAARLVEARAGDLDRGELMRTFDELAAQP